MPRAALAYPPIPASPRPAQPRLRTRRKRHNPFSRQPGVHGKPRQGVKSRAPRYAPGPALKTHENPPEITPVAAEAAVGCCVAAETAAPRIIEGINASTLARSHSISGRSSSRAVNEIAESMRSQGYVGDAIKVVESDGRMIIVDGHHRAAAAIRTQTPVNVQVLGPDAFPMGTGGWQSIDEVIQSSAGVGPNRLRPPGK